MLQWGSKEKANYCKSLGADHTILHSEEDFVAKVMEITKDSGVDVVFDLIGGEVRNQSFSCMAIEGRYIAAGFCGEDSIEQESTQASAVLRTVCAMNISVIGGLMAWRSNPEPFLRQFGLNPFDDYTGNTVHAALCEWLEQGAIRGGIHQVCEFNDLPSVLSKMQSRKSMGKTVLNIQR